MRAPDAQIKRYFTSGKTPVYDTVKWVRRSVKMRHLDGSAIELDNLEFPEFWSQNAVQIVSTKYFRGKVGTPVRENSLRQMIDRVRRDPDLG